MKQRRRIAIYVIILGILFAPLSLILLVWWNGLFVELGDLGFVPLRDKWVTWRVSSEQLRKDAWHLARLYLIKPDRERGVLIPMSLDLSTSLGVDAIILQSDSDGVSDSANISNSLKISTSLYGGLSHRLKDKRVVGPVGMANFQHMSTVWDVSAVKERNHHSSYMIPADDEKAFVVPPDLWPVSVRKFRPKKKLKLIMSSWS